MSIKKIIFILCFVSSYAHAMEMKDEAYKNLRLYLNSAHIQGPSTVRSQRYGLTMMYKSPLPNVEGPLKKRTRYGLNMNIEPDFTNRSKDVRVQQDFYSWNAFFEANYVWLFRYSIFVGPGILMSHTRSQVLDTKESHTEFSALANTGISVDYAIDRHWEISWSLQWQYRFAYDKWDWRQGLGLVYNF